ncbi:hypothetical protein CERSUDRAFT_40470, partial [Gelatoporia subvermispora B]
STCCPTGLCVRLLSHPCAHSLSCLSTCCPAHLSACSLACPPAHPCSCFPLVCLHSC